MQKVAALVVIVNLVSNIPTNWLGWGCMHKANWIFEQMPPPHFCFKVVFKKGGICLWVYSVFVSFLLVSFTCHCLVWHHLQYKNIFCYLWQSISPNCLSSVGREAVSRVSKIIKGYVELTVIITCCWEASNTLHTSKYKAIINSLSLSLFSLERPMHRCGIWFYQLHWMEARCKSEYWQGFLSGSRVYNHC